MTSSTLYMASCVLVAAATALALPTTSSPIPKSVALSKRAIMKGDDYITLGNTTVPLTPLLLIFCALGFAFVGLFLAILMVSCGRNSRVIMDERARAKQELRVRGGGPRPALSPGGSPTPGASGNRRFPPNKLPKRVGGGTGNRRHSRGYRGTSFSLIDARKNSDKSQSSSSSRLSPLGLPMLNADSSSSGSSLAVDFSSKSIQERAKYPVTLSSTQRGSFLGRDSMHGGSLSFGTRNIYRTTSIGRGTDLHRVRSGGNGIPVNPSAMDRTYVAAEPRDYRHPLDASYDLRRHITDPTGSLAASRRNSALSIYDVSSSGEHSYLDSSYNNSRISSFNLGSMQPISPRFGSVTGHHSSGTPSPRMSGYASPTGQPSQSSKIKGGANRAYDSDEGDAITPQSGLLSNTRGQSTFAKRESSLLV